MKQYTPYYIAWYVAKKLRRNSILNMRVRMYFAKSQRMAAALPQAILRWRPDRFTLTLAALALLGAALILARQVNYGVDLMFGDSAVYISVARHLLMGEGFVNMMDKTPYEKWPPLYPILLAAASLFVFDPYTVAGPLNAAIFGLTIFAAGHYLRQRIHSRFLILWACLAFLLSVPLTSIAYMAISEPLFILLVILSLLHTDTFLGQGKRTSLLWAAVFTALACLTRYFGLTLPMTIVPLILLQRNTALVAKMKHITAYTLISVPPIALWMLRNFLLAERPTGPRPPSDSTLSYLLDFMLNTLSRWVFLDLPLGEFQRFAVALTGLALLALAIALGLSIIRAQQKGGTWTNWSPFYIFGSFALVYLISLLGSTATLTGEPPNNRYLSPVYIPLLFTAVFVMDRFLRAEQQRKLLGTTNDLPFIRTIVPRRVKQASLLIVLLSASLSLWLGWSVPINARAIRQDNMPTSYVGTIYLQFADSQALQYMRDNSIDGAIVSNLWQGVLYLPTTEYHFLDPIRYWPAPMVASADSGRRADYHHIPSEQWYRYMTRLFIGNTDDDVYLVWFYCGRHPISCDTTWFYGGFQTPNLDTLPELEPIAELTDAVILKVNKAYGNADAYRAITDTQPLVRSNFNLYLNDNTLHYVRDTCRPDDIRARFFLHIVPHDTNDLPQHRLQYGFDNLNFDFYEHGVRFDGKCLASVPLPDYPIARINTGQWIPDEGRLWEGEFPFHEEP